MAVKIRLTRMGAKKRPFYRLVVADSRMPRDGRFIEILGHYNPSQKPAKISVNQEKALYWLKQGAKPSEVVKQVFKKCGVWKEFKPSQSPKKAEK